MLRDALPEGLLQPETVDISLLGQNENSTDPKPVVDLDVADPTGSEGGGAPAASIGFFSTDYSQTILDGDVLSESGGGTGGGTLDIGPDIFDDQLVDVDVVDGSVATVELLGTPLDVDPLPGVPSDVQDLLEI